MGSKRIASVMLVEDSAKGIRDEDLRIVAHLVDSIVSFQSFVAIYDISVPILNDLVDDAIVHRERFCIERYCGLASPAIVSIRINDDMGILGDTADDRTLIVFMGSPDSGTAKTKTASKK